MAQSDLPKTTSLMQDAFSVVNPFRPVVTSVMHGGHAKDSAHYAGRAVDVGAFGEMQVGWNQPTWQAVSTAIGSGRFQKIGTIAQIANNPQMQAWAQKNGVELFYDPGSGPHVHFQVAPNG